MFNKFIIVVRNVLVQFKPYYQQDRFFFLILRAKSISKMMKSIPVLVSFLLIICVASSEGKLVVSVEENKKLRKYLSFFCEH